MALAVLRELPAGDVRELPGERFEDVWLRPVVPVGVRREEKPTVVLVVGGGAPDP